MKMKYQTLKILLICSYGASTGMAPAHVRETKRPLKTQKFILSTGIVFFDDFNFFFIESTSRRKIDINSLTTPPSLLGIDRRIA